MLFSGSGHIANNGNLDTRGDMTAFSAEVVINGDAKSDPEAALLSYTSDRPYSGFSLWGPQALYIEIGSMNYPTNLNVADGQPHRLTVSWQQAGGSLVLYDNGREVWHLPRVNIGGTIGGNGKLTIGEYDASSGWGAGTYEHGYTGSIVAATLANRAISTAEIASGTLANVLRPSSDLIADVIMGPNGQPVDTTGRASFGISGGVRAQSAGVSTSVYVDRNCQ